MNKLPDIVISAKDLERLEAVLDALPRDLRAAGRGLNSELSRARFADSAEIPPDVVTMNSIVRFTMPPLDEVHDLRLCYPADMDGSAGQISVLTPVGTALLGLSKGQEITWAGPGGKPITLRVIEVVFQPERSGAAAI